ncbi:MAG: NUDIX hydrolase [Longimicrobiales bacterium]|nr:NUDIX hydrolase [Longimicrobiales bacterium]
MEAGEPDPSPGSIGSDDFDEESAGGVVVRRIEGRPHVLLILDPYGKWGLPKGHLEGSESSEEAADREVREETGLEDVSPGPEVETITWSFRREGREIRKVCTFYLMISQEGEVRPEVTEGITECAWLPLDEAVRRVDYDNTRQVIRKAEEMIGNGSGPRAEARADGDRGGL